MSSAMPDAVLLLPWLRVQNANAISGPFSWGFPAPSAFTGFTHALSRRLSDTQYADWTFGGTGIVCHAFEPQVTGRYVKNFRLTRNPNDEHGNPPAFVEEGRAHLTISLLIGVHGDSVFDLSSERLSHAADELLSIAQGMRLAGGSLLPTARSARHQPMLTIVPDSEGKERDAFRRRLRRRLLPGFALVSRSDRLQQRLDELRQQFPASPLDALLDLCARHWECTPALSEDGKEHGEWSIRRRRGWLVPVPMGYAAISRLHEPGTVRNARDPSVPFRFVESVYGLGEWVSPHRVDDPMKLFWHHFAQPEQGLYRCINSAFDSLPVSV